MRISDWSSDVCSSDLCWREMDLGTEFVADLRQHAHRADGGVVIIIGARLVRAADMHDHALLVPAGGHDTGTPACPHRLVDVGLDLRQPLVAPVHARPVIPSALRGGKEWGSTCRFRWLST